MIRINREFCITDSSVNAYGYRLLTSGLDLDRFRPSVGFLMHDRDKGVAVQWVDFRIEDDSLYATPVVNDTLFPDLAKQIEEGFINAASVGHIVALQLSDDPADKLPGQDGPTVLRWFPREVSLVDIPGNYNATGLAKLYDESDRLLADLSAPINPTQPPKSMNIVELFPNLAQADDTAIRAYVNDLQQRAERAAALQTEIDQLRAERANAELNALLDAAVNEHRITAEQRNLMATGYAGRVEELRSLLATFPARQSVPTPTPTATPSLAGKSWDELDRSGELAKLKAESPELFAQKFEEKFGHRPK